MDLMGDYVDAKKDVIGMYPIPRVNFKFVLIES